MDEDPQQTLSIPSLLAFAIVSFFAIRYFFFSSSSTTPLGTNTSSAFIARRGNGRRAIPAESVDTVAGMFPQASRKDIEWDLVNNGGSVASTTEKILSGSLPVAPVTFSPMHANDHARPAASPPTSGTAANRNKQTYQDLITRYNLSSRIATAKSDADPDQAESRQKGGWSSSKADRQALLKRRREDMILAARKKLEDKDRKGKDKAL